MTQNTLQKCPSLLHLVYNKTTVLYNTTTFIIKLQTCKKNLNIDSLTR